MRRQVVAGGEPLYPHQGDDVESHSSYIEAVMCVFCGDSKEVTHMVRWQIRYIRAAIALGGFAALLVDAGAGLRWK